MTAGGKDTMRRMEPNAWDKAVQDQLDAIGFTETEPFETGFAAYFDEKIKPMLLTIEGDRLTRLAERERRKPIFFGLAGVIVVLGLILIYSVSDRMPLQKDGSYLFLIPGFAILMAYFWFESPTVGYVATSRKTLVDLVLGFFGPGYVFSEGAAAPVTKLEESLIMPSANRNVVHGRITGTYNGIDLSVYDLNLETGGQNSTTMFSGLFAVLEVHRRFNGVTLVTKDGPGLFGQSPSRLQGLERVELESQEFEDKYDVYSTSQIEARYLLPPDIMESVIELSKVSGQPARLSFIGQRLFLAIPQTKHLFPKSPIFKTVLDAEDVHKFLHQIRSILNIIDLLKLDHAAETVPRSPNIHKP